MKRLALIIFILGSHLWVFGQSACDVMNKDYDAYLQENRNLLDSNDHLKLQEVAQCYLNNKLIKKENSNYELPAGNNFSGLYTLPSAGIEDDPVLLFLIFNSRSLDSRAEKQNWFNLYPLMNSVQISKLYKILMKEKIKLQEIALKYEEKKLEIKKKIS